MQIVMGFKLQLSIILDLYQIVVMNNFMLLLKASSFKLSASDCQLIATRTLQLLAVQMGEKYIQIKSKDICYVNI